MCFHHIFKSTDSFVTDAVGLNSKCAYFWSWRLRSSQQLADTVQVGCVGRLVCTIRCYQNKTLDVSWKGASSSSPCTFSTL